MTGTPAHRAPSRPFAVAVRIVAFLVGVASIVTIPTALVVASLHHATLPVTLATVAVAAILITAAAFAARSVDPLRA
jgi:hypothetical protein